MSVSAIIVAGGKGIRMGSATRKQYMLLAGKPIVCHTLAVFDACPCIEEMYLVVPPDDLDTCSEKWISSLTLHKKIHLVAGGIERQDSVFQGIQAISGQQCEVVVIHDAVRPFVSSPMIEACVGEARISGACIVGMPAMDTAKLVNSGRIERTLDRNTIWMAQTPQAFDLNLIRTAHEQARSDRFTGTDDAMLVERLGRKVRIIAGSRLNMKITTPEDLALAEGILHRMPTD
ncbi:MAG: 2-C-methyl-D-erythritol 4-phosphate cytidylyltransferase [Deltaproteobacteria bacterium]|nr:2-C-methyl-D-erythritol 4-phosphate cytidylyltransferase [Deltaproteobacteria bacterium]